MVTSILIFYHYMTGHCEPSAQIKRFLFPARVKFVWQVFKLQRNGKIPTRLHCKTQLLPSLGRKHFGRSPTLSAHDPDGIGHSVCCTWDFMSSNNCSGRTTCYNHAQLHKTINGNQNKQQQQQQQQQQRRRQCSQTLLISIVLCETCHTI